MSKAREFLEVVRENLHKNTVTSAEGELVLAGSRQFKTLWVRDFCYAVPGLLKLGRHELVDRQLKIIYGFRRPDLPRGLDVVDVKWRVLMNTIGRYLPIPFKGEWLPGMKLVPEYNGEHGTPAFDSNLLFLMALAELKSRFSVTWISHEQEWELFSVYEKSIQEGLLRQPKFSDWQDSARREGAVLLSHLYYLEVLHRYSHLSGSIQEDAIFSLFFDPQKYLFREFPGSEQISLDSHCFLLKRPHIFPQLDRARCFEALVKSSLWLEAGISGLPIFPPYLSSQQSWTTKAIGLGRYHDGYVWGWLSAEAFALCLAFGRDDLAEEIFAPYYEQSMRDRTCWELLMFNNGVLAPYESWLYKSEGPFSWTAAKWAEALLEK